MIGDRGRWRSLLGRVGGLSVRWPIVLVTLRVCSGQGDGAMWCMERRRDGFRDRRVGDHLLAMQGPRGLDTDSKGNLVRSLGGSTGSGPLLVTSLLEALEGVNIRGCCK